MNKKFYFAFVIVCALGFAGSALASLTLSTTTIAGSGDVVVTSNGTTAATFSVPTGASSTSNFLNITGTMPATLTALARGVNIQITSNGSTTGFGQVALQVNYLAGYTGASGTSAATFVNALAGTGTASWANGAYNIGASSFASGTTVGHNVGSYSSASNSSVLNMGQLSRAVTATNSPTLNVGSAGLALNATTNIGGFFGLMSTAPTLSTSSALIADNGAVAADIFEARDNGTPVFTIADGGTTIATGSIDAGSFKVGGVAGVSSTNPVAVTLVNGIATSATSRSVQNVVPLAGDTITITRAIEAWLVLTPAGTLATLTINMPASPQDGDFVDISSSQTVTTLTLNGNGSTLYGPVSGLPNTAAKYRYNAATSAWYRW